jgi:hypothetical protein
MKNFKVSFIVTLTILIAVCSCEKDNPVKAIYDDKNITTIAGTWKVISYDDFTSNTQIKKDTNNTWTNFNNGDVIVTFTDTLPLGRIHGRTVTNEVFGNYTLLGPRTINVENFGGTLINQPDWADFFWENIKKSEEYSVNNTHLRIFYNSKKNSITFEKE